MRPPNERPPARSGSAGASRAGLGHRGTHRCMTQRGWIRPARAPLHVGKLVAQRGDAQHTQLGGHGAHEGVVHTGTGAMGEDVTGARRRRQVQQRRHLRTAFDREAHRIARADVRGGHVTFLHVKRKTPRLHQAALAMAACYLLAPGSADAAAATPAAAGEPASAVVNDVTGLNPIPVRETVAPRSVGEISRLVREHHGPICIGGARHSQGGQIATDGCLFLDMRAMNRVLAFDPQARRITVEAGITWRGIQEAIDPHGLSVKVMQTYANFTVGGSLSVNAHGRYVGQGALAGLLCRSTWCSPMAA